MECYVVVRVVFSSDGRTHCGGHIVADTNVSICPRAKHNCGHKICFRDTKMFLTFSQKHFMSTANVSLFARTMKHHEQQCVRYNGSPFTTTLMLLLVTGKTTCANWQWIPCSISSFLLLIMLVTTPIVNNNCHIVKDRT